MQAISKLPRSVSYSGTRPSVIANLTLSYQQAGRHLPRTLQLKALKHEHARYLHPITLIPGARPGASFRPSYAQVGHVARVRLLGESIERLDVLITQSESVRRACGGDAVDLDHAWCGSALDCRHAPDFRCVAKAAATCHTMTMSQDESPADCATGGGFKRRRVRAMRRT